MSASGTHIPFGAVVLVVAALLTGCAGTAKVAMPEIQVPTGMEPVRGNFAALVQLGGWKLTADSTTFTCSAWTFDTDMNDSFDRAVRSTLSKGLQHVSFVDAVLSPDELKRQGYDGQVIIHQGNAAAKFGIQSMFLSARSTAGIELTSIMAINRPTRQPYQVTITGNGAANADIFVCDDAGQAIGQAATRAIEDITTKMLLYVRDALKG